jgi:hypothetical protein
MALRILSFFIEGVTWRVAQTPNGYCHRDCSTMPEWISGIPSGVAKDIVDSTFQQFPPEDNSLQPHEMTFKLTYRIGHSNIECFIFASPEGDLFNVRIPPATFTALQEALPSQTIPRMRVARIALQHAISFGLPGIDLLPDSQIFESVKSHLVKTSLQLAQKLGIASSHIHTRVTSTPSLSFLKSGNPMEVPKVQQEAICSFISSFLVIPRAEY